MMRVGCAGRKADEGGCKKLGESWSAHGGTACPRGEFACQAGLPDAALATEEDEGAYSVAEFSQETVERSKPVRTPDQAGAVDVSTSTGPELAVPRLTAQFAEHGRDIAGIA